MHIEQVSSSLHNILDKALNGRNISLHDGYELMEAPTESIPAICEVASKLRSRTKGQTVTYSRKVFIPLTTLCRDSCGYCTFAKPPDHPDAITLNPDEVLTIARTGEKNGCKEALFSLGERPELTHEIARKHLRQLGLKSLTYQFQFPLTHSQSSDIEKNIFYVLPIIYVQIVRELQ